MIPIQLHAKLTDLCPMTLNLGQHDTFKDFYTKLCVCCTNEIYKTYQTGFSFCHLGHAPGVGLWGARGAPGGE